MANIGYDEQWSDINTKLYERSVTIFAAVKNLLSVKLKLHADTQVIQGDIFLFNHFSRFETFIPQFLIFEKTGAYSCAIASSEFFKEETVLSRYLKHVGVFPHNHPQLFPLLAAQVLRGRKVIIFPEGGMVKDRRVMDNQGHYNIYSRITGERRKQHTGAAVLAQGIEAFKATVRNAYAAKNQAQLLRWKDELQFDTLDELLLSALKPTLIVPSNITFYPIRSSDNLLKTGVELFTNNLSYRQIEELLVEGNILLKNTDMDIRMGQPIDAYHVWHWWNRYLLELVSSEFNNLSEVFSLHNSPKNWRQKLLGSYLKKAASATRNQYMKAIYAQVTINLSHLASTLIMYCLEIGQNKISHQTFFNCLYIAVKRLQNRTSINLHRSLLNPHEYSDLTAGTNKRFEQFICIAKKSELINEQDACYYFLPKLLQEFHFDHIRLENPIAVYHNEVKPITAVRDAVINAFIEHEQYNAQQLAQWYFDDECVDLGWEQHAYKKPRFDDINSQETATADAMPFFLQPNHANGFGILLIHGLLASPAELRDYGHYLVEQGYTVLGIRLKGHGSSPYCLQEQTHQDWYFSVKRGFTILKAYTSKIFVTGFSTGGVLALKLASEQHAEIIGITAVALPLQFTNPAFMLVSLLHGTNKLLEWVPNHEGIKPFIENEQEHPDINYRHIPIKALYELRLLIHDMDDFLPLCTCSTLIIHAEHDPVVSVNSAYKVFENFVHSDKQLKIILANHHGILMENTNETWQIIDNFMCCKQN